MISSVGGMWNCRVTAQRGMHWIHFVSLFAVSWTEESWMRVLSDISVQWLLIHLVYLRSFFSVTQDLHRENLHDSQPPDLMSCFFGLCSSRGCSGSSASFWAKAKQTCSNQLFLVNTFFFSPTNPEGVLSALLWICTSFSVWRCLRKGIWKVCQHYELLYYN